MLIAELRQKLERRDDFDDIKKSITELQALLAMIQQDVASPAAPEAREPDSNRQAKPDDDIIDAEVTAA